MLQHFPNKSLGLFLTDVFWRAFPSAGRERFDLFISQKFPRKGTSDFGQLHGKLRPAISSTYTTMCADPGRPAGEQTAYPQPQST